ncbi:lipopolysaccharide biosynthesis protein [Priestia megaterium]|uniref:lipopolysaccharide biosynthesis protein n=1 Tax=Priestia megaterium TaxID=1404 RepID=UPI003F7F81CC
MEEKIFKDKVLRATKWSTVTQLVAKIIVPLTNMILARILVPEAFGVITTVTMIISFADMFTDAGFQKYLVQHEFKSRKEKYQSANVAFWTNMAISILLWIIIAVFNEQIAAMVGNPGLGIVIIVSCFQLPLTAFSSIQMALFTREFDFKTLFVVRVISIIIPFAITIPLAIIGFSYWSLIIGTITMQLFNALTLTIKSAWKPQFFYDIGILKEMLSFSIWSLVEAVSIWLTAWIDAFIIGYYLSDYYLGIYKTSTTMVNSLLALVTASTVPVLFSALSRLQGDQRKFQDMFFKFQKFISLFVFPMGAGVYIYSDIATKIMLGDQWVEASKVIGIWALMSSIMIVLGHYCSEVYRASGKPKLSFIAQLSHLVILVPTCILSAKFGFWPLVFARSLIRMQFVSVHLVIMQKIMRISIYNTLKNISPSVIATIIMAMAAYLLREISHSMIWSIVSIILSGTVYLIALLLFKDIRDDIFKLVNKVVPKRFLKVRI